MAAARVTRFLPSRHLRDNLDTCVADVEFEFLHDGETLLAHSACSDDCHNPNEIEFDEDEDHRDTVEQNRTFWDTQNQILQVV